MDENSNNRRELRIAYRKGYLAPENDGAYWTEEDRALLVHRYLDIGIGITELAEEFGRYDSAIVQQLMAMGAFTPPTVTRRRCPRKEKCLCSKCNIKDCIYRRNGVDDDA